MKAKSSDLPATMRSPETGALLRRGVRAFVVRYKGLSMTVDLPGYYAKASKESIHVGDDMAATDRALRVLKERADGVPAPDTIRRIRKSLKLSQRAAGALFRVGPNAFDKYERGLIEPSGPTIQLLGLLSRRAELVEELRAGAAKTSAVFVRPQRRKSTRSIDWSKAQRVVMPNLKRSVDPAKVKAAG